MSIARSSRISKKSNTSVLKRKASLKEDIKICLADIGVYTRTVQEEDLVIQRDRVGYILEKTIQRIKVAISLRQLLQDNASILRYFVKPFEVNKIKNACSFYTNPPEVSSRTTSEQQDPSSVDTDTDPEIIQALDTLWFNKRLREKILADLEDTDDPSCYCFMFINALKSLQDVAKLRLDISAAEEKNQDRCLRKVHRTQASLQEHINKVVEEIDLQRETLGKEVERRKDLVEEYKLQIDYFKKKFKSDVIDKVIESEADMLHERNISLMKQEGLAYEANKSSRLYENLLNKHLYNEKNLRKKRLKVETQLISWLAKYDADVGERQDVFEELTKAYETEKAEYDQLQANFDLQEEDYVTFMAEKEEERQRVFEERLYAFVCNRAAKRLQRYWRAYKQRKRDKKKKKGKGKENKPKVEQLDLGEKWDGEPPKRSIENEGNGKARKGKDKGKGQVKAKKAGEGGGLRGVDPSAVLDKKFDGGIFDELQGDDFKKEDIKVEL